MKKIWIYLLTLLEGLIGCLYFLPIWSFPNYSSMRSLELSNRYGLSILIIFLVISILSIISLFLRCYTSESLALKIISFVTICISLIILLPFLFLSYTFVMSIMGIDWFPSQN